MRGAAWLAPVCALALAALVHASRSGGPRPRSARDHCRAQFPARALPRRAAADAGSDASAPPAPSLPTHIPVTPPSYEVLDAGSDRPIRVLPAAKPGRRVLVYLHGYCGDVNAVGAFVPAAAAHGTLIALLGDQPCKDKPGRFKWSTRHPRPRSAHSARNPAGQSRAPVGFGYAAT